MTEREKIPYEKPGMKKIDSLTGKGAGCQSGGGPQVGCNNGIEPGLPGGCQNGTIHTP